MAEGQRFASSVRSNPDPINGRALWSRRLTIARQLRKRVPRRPVRRRPRQSARRQSGVTLPVPRLHNLPTQLTSFIGREHEIADVKHILETTRLLTLTGSGGCGKTRLALQVARDLIGQYADGVWFVDLAPLADPAFLANRVAAALGVPEQPNRPIIDTLAKYLRAKNLMLVLDNCEHLRVVCQDLVDRLLQASDTIRILSSSRERLGAEGEIAYRVPSLGLPDTQQAVGAGELVRYDAIRLFTERAAHAQWGFSLTELNAPAVVQICRRLDGLPLAIEFAVACLMVLSVEQIAARLDDRFRLLTAGTTKTLARQQTLQATLDWSYDLLTENERALLRRISVFAGGWTLEAAEAVCAGNGIESADVLSLLSQLIGKSLVVADTRNEEARYSLLETVRQYAQHKLEEKGEADCMGGAHRDWYLAFVEHAAPRTRGRDAERWLARLETEHDNLRAALAWSKGEPDGADAELLLAGALHWFWYLRGYWNEAREAIQHALERWNDVPCLGMTRALRGATHLAYRQGDYASAVAFGEKGVALCRQLNDQENGALLLAWLAGVATDQGDYARATALFEESFSLCEALQQPVTTAIALANWGALVRRQGDYDRATVLLTKARDQARNAGDKAAIAATAYYLGMDTLHQNHHNRAAEYLRESLRVSGEMKHKWWITAVSLGGLARVYLERRCYETAARLYGAADALHEILGSHPSPLAQTERAATRAALGTKPFEVAWREGRAMTLEQAIEYALMGTEDLQREPTRSKRLAGPTQQGLLTTRERDVAGLIAQGLTNREIASSLEIAARTVDTHVEHILNKLGFKARTQIAVWASDAGLRRVSPAQ